MVRRGHAWTLCPRLWGEGSSALQPSDVTAPRPSSPGLGQACWLPRKGPQKAKCPTPRTSCPVLGEGERKRGRRGVGLPAWQEVPASLGSGRGPMD